MGEGARDIRIDGDASEVDAIDHQNADNKIESDSFYLSGIQFCLFVVIIDGWDMLHDKI
ncbi:hypothetical protein PBN151_0755 [Paenibacillus sp. NAIST15-1]|nr:hypothetical protein PBN151_0755 [Paenibacillus sp. NAIST15-1]